MPDEESKAMPTRYRGIAVLLSALAACLLGNARTTHAEARLVTVTVEQIRALDPDDFDPPVCLPFCVGGSDADFYAVVGIDGHVEDTRDNFIEDQSVIFPNWSFQRP